MATQQRLNTTRLELLKQKKQLQLASRGHKLLKEKRDGLMREFLKIIRETKALRLSVDTALSASARHFIVAQSQMLPEALHVLSQFQLNQVTMKVTESNVMGVRLPDFTATLKRNDENYGVWEMSPAIDSGLATFQTALPDLLKLATLEKSAELLAQEIEKTRRRVNALEYVLIPQRRAAIRFIRLKLEEQERAGIVTRQRVKQKIE
jgi:V/A-type H+-transporting ATPase subunit D